MNLSHMELMWARTGDTVVSDGSVHLDTVPSTGFNHKHRKLRTQADSMTQAREYLLDDPPPARPVAPG